MKLRYATGVILKNLTVFISTFVLVYSLCLQISTASTPDNSNCFITTFISVEENTELRGSYSNVTFNDPFGTLMTYNGLDNIMNGDGTRRTTPIHVGQLALVCMGRPYPYVHEGDEGDEDYHAPEIFQSIRSISTLDDIPFPPNFELPSYFE